MNQVAGVTTDADGPVDGDEAFDPVGTLTLILLYLVILVVAWLHLYFTEFLARDLVVVG